MNLRIAALCLILGSTLARADDVKSILERMNAAAPNFHAAAADVRMDTYESILDSHTIENGTLQMQRKSPKDVRAILEFKGESSARTLFFQGKKLIIYYPKTDYYQEFDLGSNSQLLNQYLLLGFGSSGNDLAANYDISDGGQPETVAGVTTTKLVLTPKDESVKKNLSKIEIWFPSDGANPVQQKFYQTNGDYRMVTYTNLKINPPIAGSLQFRVPKTAQKRS